MYPQVAEFRIGWRSRPRWIPTFLWRRLLDLTTRPDCRVRKGRPIFTEHIVMADSIFRMGPEIWEKEQRLAIESMSRRLGPQLIGHLAGLNPKTISVTLERTECLEVGGDDFHMTIWEFKEMSR